MNKRVFSTILVTTALYGLLIAGCGSPPEGPTLIYHSLGEESRGLWRMMADGSDVLHVTTSGWFGAYSPDSTQIAYSEPYDEGIWVMKADGTSPHQLTSFGSAPSWSPDGSRLVFHAGGVKGADRRLWIMNADGTEVQQLSAVSGSFPDWSPAGDEILFHGEVNSGIWSINPDGSNETLLYRMGGYPAWSPDGEEIAYVDLRDWCIWVMDADGGSMRKLTDHRGGQPAWSADGLQIAHEGPGKEGTGIWVINADGSEGQMINDEGHHPDWSD